MIFFLDTRTRDVQFRLLHGKSIVSEYHHIVPKPGGILLAVEQFLRQSYVPFKRLTQITVVTGPGMFSFLRAGLVIANTMAVTLHVPLLGVRAKNETDAISQSIVGEKTSSKKPLRPWYGRAPSITIGKIK